MTSSPALTKLLDLVIPRKREFAERLFLVISTNEDDEEFAIRRVSRTLTMLKYIDTTKL